MFNIRITRFTISNTNIISQYVDTMFYYYS